MRNTISSAFLKTGWVLSQFVAVSNKLKHSYMKIVALIARLLLGLMFFVFGLNGFLHFIPASMPPGPAGQFFGAMFASHYAYLVFGVQFIGGVLLLANQFVPLALVLLAAVIVNILVFHITMQPAGLAPGVTAAILWLIVAYQVRTALRPLFTNTRS